MKKNKTIKLGDWWLLTLFFVLVAQSTFGLFFPSEAVQEVQSIDIVFRTSIAAIFGYVISTNFGRKTEVNATTQPLQSSNGGAIGFTTPDDQAPTASLPGRREVAQETQTATPITVKKQRKAMTNTAQLTLVGIIGLVSLLVLIVWRNTLTLGMDMDSSMTSIISQFRDMVSGCVGFLIGYPQEEKSINED